MGEPAKPTETWTEYEQTPPTDPATIVEGDEANPPETDFCQDLVRDVLRQIDASKPTSEEN
jgi:hypothetical protein